VVQYAYVAKIKNSPKLTMPRRNILSGATLNMLQYDSKYEERFKGSWGIPEYRWMFAPNDSVKFIQSTGVENKRTKKTTFLESLISLKAASITITNKGSMYLGCTNSPTTK
jgi:hypothetical protein